MSTHASDFTIRLGNIQTNGRLLRVRKGKAKDSEFKLCTPTGDPVSMAFLDPELKAWSKKDLLHGKVTDKGLQPVSNEEYEKATAAKLPLNVLELGIFKADQVDQHCFPDDSNSYVFEPVKKGKTGLLPEDPNNIKQYEFIYAILSESDVALVGTANIQGTDGLIRLSVHQGNICLSRQLWPEYLNQFEPRPLKYMDGPIKDKALATARNKIKDFDPSNFVDEKTQSLIALEPGDGDFDGAPIDQSTEPEVDLMAMLDEFDI